MELQTFFQGLKDSLLDRATVGTVYGEPVTVAEKKVIPVARVFCGFGGGAGTSKLSTNGPQAGGEGGGGGGGLVAIPIGVVEITPQQTRFVRFGHTRRLLVAAAVGTVAGMIVGWRRFSTRR
jgi:uncharacterized spore protein YtfJ